MRAFIALPIDLKTTNLLHDKVCLLKNQAWYPNITWFKPTNYHLTVRFLGGHLENNKIDKIVNSIDDWFTFSEIGPFSIQLSNLELFPSSASAHTIIASINPNHTLFQLEAMLNTYLKQIGLEKPQQTFVPHISLGKIHKGSDLCPISIPDAIASFNNIRLNINSINLYQSELTTHSPIYTVLKTVYLYPHSKEP
ncbi:MAG: RNA 2',3'-cyclic phosphodiesterase [Thiomicrorhabdus sp.]|nr:RNA 2',3'-cyclic phosphodiesterase [Thiomicrorhabdus sp.]